MNILWIIVLSILGIGALLLVWAIGGYNQLVKLKALLQEAWSGVEVQLKRRYDLIPNLVETVKGYAGHEKSVFENVTKMRSIAMGTSEDNVEKKAEAEKGLTGALKTLFAVAENYPDLKANENFLSLQQDLNEIERELQLARRYYNGTVRNYNVLVRSFPTNIIAGFFGFSAEDYFAVESDKEREAPKVDF